VQIGETSSIVTFFALRHGKSKQAATLTPQMLRFDA
jgi:hypothetical protein